MTNNSLYFTCIFFIFIMFLIYYNKPKFIFDKNNKIKTFGIGKNKTILTLPIFSILIIIIIYFLFFMIEKQYSNIDNYNNNNNNQLNNQFNNQLNNSNINDFINFNNFKNNKNNNLRNNFKYKLVKTTPDGSIIFE